MGLFGAKDPCAICGGKVKGLFKNKVEGQYVCNECYGNVDVPDDVRSNMTMEAFKEYRAFREENSLLKEKFVTSEVIDFGIFDTKLVFDYENKLLCFDKGLNTTIFEGKHIESFTILEDIVPLFEGNAQGLRRCNSPIPERVLVMGPQINEYLMRKRMRERMKRDDDDWNDDIYMDIPEPFKHFNLVIKFKHPYWKEFKADMSAPTFNNSTPSVDDYLREYNEKAETMLKLAQAFMKIAFEGAPEQTVSAGGMGYTTATQTATTSSEDAADAIRKFKELLDQGLITEEEFNAKKRQILGI